MLQYILVTVILIDGVGGIGVEVLSTPFKVGYDCNWTILCASLEVFVFFERETVVFNWSIAVYSSVASSHLDAVFEDHKYYVGDIYWVE